MTGKIVHNLFIVICTFFTALTVCTLKPIHYMDQVSVIFNLHEPDIYCMKDPKLWSEAGNHHDALK